MPYLTISGGLQIGQCCTCKEILGIMTSETIEETNVFVPTTKCEERGHEWYDGSRFLLCQKCASRALKEVIDYLLSDEEEEDQLKIGRYVASLIRDMNN